MDKSGGPVEENDIGPVDNTDLVDHDGNLISNITEGVNVEFVPEDTWKAFIAWYVGLVQNLDVPLIYKGTGMVQRRTRFLGL